MVDLFSRRQHTAFFTKLAKRMGGNIPVAYAHPGTAVAFLGSRVTLVPVISFGLQPGMLFAKLTVGQQWTAGVGARAHWLAGHGAAPSKGKTLTGLLLEGCDDSFDTTIIPHGNVHFCTQTGVFGNLF